MKKIFPILKLTAELATINRTVGYRRDHFENDSEHSYQLAMACWSANEQYSLGLNTEIILKLALVHDRVEVSAGDTDAHDKIKALSKKENEAMAFEKLKLEYANFKELLEMIELYESRGNDEAKLVHFLDKVIPDVNIYNAGSSYYKDRKVTFDGWTKWLFGKIDYDSLNSKIKLLVDDSILEIKTHFQDIFYKEMF